MLEDTVVAQCSPTMAGIKTGSLFSYAMYSREELLIAIRRLNAALVHKGVRLIPLRYEGTRALLYMYRPELLKEDLKKELTIEILTKMQYPPESPESCIVELARRLKNEEEFPHEIGLFLGYPPEDVQGFMENKAGNAKCIGAWKVYGNVLEAQKKFAQYKRCTARYQEAFHRHNSIERLVVAVS